MKIKSGDYQFNCPGCRGHYYGSTLLATNKRARQCHSNRDCTFAWHEDEDWKYFAFIVRFANRDEHDFYWQMYRNAMEDLINGVQEESEGGGKESETCCQSPLQAPSECPDCACFGTP